jgi:hypothetical protein
MGRTNMSFDLFSAGWAAALQEEINASGVLGGAGSAWDGTIVLVAARAAAVDGSPAVRVKFRDRRCEGAQPASREDLATADFVIRAEEPTWRSVFVGRMDLMLAIMLGRFSMLRGSLQGMLQHASTARGLIGAAGRVDTSWDSDR